jgi:hypothetical protein
VSCLPSSPALTAHAWAAGDLRVYLVFGTYFCALLTLTTLIYWAIALVIEGLLSCIASRMPRVSPSRCTSPQTQVWPQLIALHFPLPICSSSLYAPLSAPSLTPPLSMPHACLRCLPSPSDGPSPRTAPTPSPAFPTAHT